MALKTTVGYGISCLHHSSGISWHFLLLVFFFCTVFSSSFRWQVRQSHWHISSIQFYGWEWQNDQRNIHQLIFFNILLYKFKGDHSWYRKWTALHSTGETVGVSNSCRYKTDHWEAKASFLPLTTQRDLEYNFNVVFSITPTFQWRTLRLGPRSVPVTYLTFLLAFQRP